MGFTRFAGLAAMLAAATPAVTSAAEAPIDMPPNSKWHVNYRDSSCFLGRSFSGGGREIILSFTQFYPGSGFSLQAYGAPFAADGPFQNVRVAFGPNPADQPLRNRLSGRADKLPFVDLGNFTLLGPAGNDDGIPAPLTAEQETATTVLTIGPHKGRTYRLLLGPMHAAMDAMRTCTDDLMRHWGYDPAVLATIRNPAEPLTSPGTWLRSKDYPTGMLYGGQLGSVEFRLDVDANGDATGCNVLRRAGEEAFAKVTCDTLMQRARFRPALNVAGLPLRSFYVSRVNWLIHQ